MPTSADVAAFAFPGGDETPLRRARDLYWGNRLDEIEASLSGLMIDDGLIASIVSICDEYRAQLASPRLFRAPRLSRWATELRRIVKLEAKQQGNLLAHLRDLQLAQPQTNGCRYLPNTPIELLKLSDVPDLIGRSATGKWQAVCDSCARSALGSALGVIKDLWPEAFVDVVLLCDAIAPLRSRFSKRAGISTPDLPFVVGVSIHENHPLLQAELVLHELCHVKLDLLHSNTPLVHSSHHLLVKHPWRQEPRPLIGLLFGVHAFAAVAELYHRAVQRNASCELLRQTFEAHYADVATALALLREATGLTSTGQQVSMYVASSLAHISI